MSAIVFFKAAVSKFLMVLLAWSVGPFPAKLIAVDASGRLIDPDVRDHVDEVVSLLEALAAENSTADEILHVAEIGVHQAKLSVQILKKIPSSRMLLVDPYLGEGEEAFGDKAAFESASAALEPYRDRATQVLQKSGEAARWIRPSSFDFVFIDGDHSYEAVQVDIEGWWPLVREGGVLAGHDYVGRYPGVIKAVNEFAIASDVKLYLTPAIWWVFKPHSNMNPKDE